MREYGVEFIVVCFGQILQVILNHFHLTYLCKSDDDLMVTMEDVRTPSNDCSYKSRVRSGGQL